MSWEAWIGIIGVFLGAILGWFFNYLGHRTVVADVNQRIRNKVIYSLLNIRFELLKLNSDKNLDFALNTMERVMGEKIPDEYREAVKAKIGDDSRGLLENSAYDNLEEIGTHYKEIITSFAEIDPEGAYVLSDASKFLVVQNYFQDYMDNVRTNFSETLDQETLNRFELCFKRKNIQLSIDTLKEEIISLTSKTSKKIRKDIIDILKRQDNPSQNSEEFDECMKLLFQQN